MRLASLHRFLLAAALVATPLVAPRAADAAVPNFLITEGFLHSAAGGPAADGTYNATFALYKDKVGGEPVFLEGPVQLSVKGGVWVHALGSKQPLTPGVLSALSTAWIGVKIDNDVELPRAQVGSVAFSLRAGLAEGLDCSGCVGEAHLDPKVLEPYAKSASLHKVALSGKFEDLSGGPDLSAYAKAASLAKVATTGAYADLAGVPDLTAYAKSASLHKVAASGSYKDLADLPTLADVALTGDYADLKNAPVVPAVGKACGTGLVVKGFKGDGSLDCVLAMDPAALPADGLDEISNGLIHNQFIDSVAGKTNVLIPDNNPVGVSDVIDFPDIGIAQKLTVAVDVANSDISKVLVTLKDPDGTVFTLYDGKSTGGTLVTSYPDPTAPAKGDLTSWVGKNPKGKWTLTVVDSAFKNNTTDGAINKWSINLKTLSSKKIQVKGNAIFDGNLQLGAGGACDATQVGSLRHDAKFGGQVCAKNIAKDNTVKYAWVKAEGTPVIWSGGCQQHSQGNGWATYCLNGTDFSTAGDYIDVNANGTITFKVSGFYRIDFYAIQHGCGQHDIQFVYNGSGIAYSHLANKNSTGWRQNDLTTTWQFKAGDTFYTQLYRTNDYCNGDPYRWHSWNGAGNHSRFQIRFEGPLLN